MELTNLLAENILTSYNVMMDSLSKGEAPTLIVFGLMRNINILKSELEAYLTMKKKLIEKHNITSDEQINTTPEGQAFVEELTPIASEKIKIEFHKLNLTFEQLCEKMETCNAMIAGDVRMLSLICSDKTTITT